MGLVTVFGISARNAILQLAHYEHLVEVEGAAWKPELVMRGCQRAAGAHPDDGRGDRPGSGAAGRRDEQPGQEIEGPMAVTVLGGLLSSTLLNLIVLPALAQRYITRHAPPLAPATYPAVQA